MDYRFVRDSGGDGWTHGNIGNVVMLLYRTSMPREGVESSMRLIDRVFQQRGSVALFAVFEESAGLLTGVPSANALTTLARDVGRRAPQFSIGATVLEGTSFSSMAKRAAVGMVHILLKPPYPHRLCSTVADACDFIAPVSVGEPGSGPLDARTLHEAFAALRSGVVKEAG